MIWTPSSSTLVQSTDLWMRKDSERYRSSFCRTCSEFYIRCYEFNISRSVFSAWNISRKFPVRYFRMRGVASDDPGVWTDELRPDPMTSEHRSAEDIAHSFAVMNCIRRKKRTAKTFGVGHQQRAVAGEAAHPSLSDAAAPRGRLTRAPAPPARFSTYRLLFFSVRLFFGIPIRSERRY